MQNSLLKITALCFLAFTGGILLIFGSFSFKPAASKTTVKDSDSTQAVTQESWQTFTEPTFQYSFTYPQNWKVETSSSGLTFDSLIRISSPQNENGITDVSALVSVWKKSVAGKKIMLQEMLKDPPTGGFTNISIDNTLAYRADVKSDGEHQVDVLFEKNEQVYQMTFIIKNTAQLNENLQDVEKIIQSFKQ